MEGSRDGGQIALRGFTYYTETIKKAQRALSALSEEHFVVFPKKYYREGVLSYYPIIVHSLDITVGDVFLKFLHDCIPFTETIFDFLVVLCRNSEGKIMPTGLRASRTFFADIKRVIETNDEALAKELTFPPDQNTHPFWKVVAPLSVICSI